MATFTYKVDGLEKLVDKLSVETRGKFSILASPLRKGLTKSALLVEGQAKRLVPVDTGNLRRTITHKVDRAPIPLFAEVGTNALYARVVHDGRRAGLAPPPISALAGWASRHKIPKTALYVVARAIDRRGIKGRPFLRLALSQMRGQIDGALKTAAKEIEALWGRK